MTEKETNGVMLPIEWQLPEGTISRYANNIVVQHTEHEFILSFFEIQPPLLLGSPEEQAAKLVALGAVRAECVARIIMSPSRIQSFIEVLQRNYENYSARTQREEGEQ